MDKRSIISAGGAVMDYITTKEAADKWGITDRRVLRYCNAGRIKVAAKTGHTWLIPNSVQVGTLKIYPGSCRVMKGDEEIELTAREFEIFKYLAENKGRVISRERLYETIWREDSFGCDNTIMVHIRHLREKIEDNPKSPEYLVTMKGLGCKLVNPYEK